MIVTDVTLSWLSKSDVFRIWIQKLSLIISWPDLRYGREEYFQHFKKIGNYSACDCAKQVSWHFAKEIAKHYIGTHTTKNSPYSNSCSEFQRTLVRLISNKTFENRWNTFEILHIQLTRTPARMETKTRFRSCPSENHKQEVKLMLSHHEAMLKT